MMRLRSVLSGVTAGALVGAAIVALPVPAQAAKKGGELKVMTQNLYLGADLFPAVEAAGESTTAFLLAAAKVYQEAMVSDFPTRAAAFAKTVKEQDPDIIGLQEVTNWITSRNSEGPALQNQDFLKIVKKALKAEGLEYKVVGISDNASLGPFPYIDPGSACGEPGGMLPNTWPCSIAMKDRDVILVNTKTKGLSYSKKSVETGLYKAQQTFPVAGLTISFARGYVYADMTYKGAKFRFANTHLEVGGESEAIQEKQAKQFVKIVKKGAGTAIATGDFNTDAYGQYSPESYKILTKSYFKDTWNRKKDGEGLTCCQNAALSNPNNENTTRIDLVLRHGNVKAKGSVNTNVTPFRESPAPLYEADHGGVVATLKVK
jgi:endonuclease/exonuclease/phosphatase family metal-dependent hydrolase